MLCLEENKWNTSVQGEGGVRRCWERCTFLMILLVKAQKEGSAVSWPPRCATWSGVLCPEDLFPHHGCPGFLFRELHLRDVPSQGERSKSRIALKT